MLFALSMMSRFRPLCRQVGPVWVFGVRCVRCVGLRSLVMSAHVSGFMIAGDRSTHVVGVRNKQ